ncbi:SH3 and multiple ankyrin repeat domains protein 1 [Caerostris extrusa]|uniref:SH3 and multiple ankyrin repeat domains protein 1 n=1 Tax=Caerostris extrusa TaxID=172846 RepID=A0AAV4W362_CAEEX|nr:SH3 and multiple ankyrin repeat domains protein 1 [Caerostris extrusa]
MKIEFSESPLTLATALKQPSKVIMALINGGALLDFRTKDGLTALHKAVEKNNLDALKDSKGLTPLYYTLLHASDHQLTEILLHDHAFIGTCDPQGWQEVHQACKHGLVQHLEHLLFYGADMNARNASGNTPLHVCAVNDQESCARVLLFRGADKNALNFANQNPYQVAVIAGNLTLGELIRNHNAEDVVPYREMPRYNPRRRASIAPMATLSRTHSDPRLDLNLGMKPPSPCPSNCSLPPFSSISCISDASTGSSTCTQPSGEDSEDTASGSVKKSITSDSSGVCTSNSAASYESGPEHHVLFDTFLPGNKCVCVTNYSSLVPGHLQLSCGDTVENLYEQFHITLRSLKVSCIRVINESEDGLLLGKLHNGQVGYFPASCVQEINSHFDNLQSVGYPRVEGRRERCAKRVSTIPRRWKAFGEPRTVILHKGKKASSPLMEKESNVSSPSQYLEDVNKGGVADLAGLKKRRFLLEINGQDVSQASHEHVVSIIQQSGNLVAMTVTTPRNPPVCSVIENPPLPYRQCTTLPRKLVSKKAPAPPKRDPKTTLSVGRVRARSMVAGLAEIESLDRTLNEYDSEGRSTKSSSVESIPNKTAMKAANSHLTKTASIKARPSSQRVSAAELEQFFARQGSKRHLRSHTLNTRSRADGRPPKVYGSVAEMKRSKASRSKLTEVTLKVNKEFSSTPDLKAANGNSFSNNQVARKKSLSQEDLQNIQGNRHSWACTPNGYNSYLGLCDNEEYSLNYNDAWKSIEDVYDSTIPVEHRDKNTNSDIYAQTLPITKKDKSFRASCPPPSHPPPPPPVGQVVKVDVSKALGEYANVNMMDEDRDSQVMSSFRPGDSAKLYASPEVVMSVGYKSEPVSVTKDAVHPRRSGGGSSLRSQSLPPKISVNKSDKGSTTSSEAENSGDSGGLYSTFKKTSRQRDSLSTDSGHVSDRGALWSLKGKSAVTSSYSSKFDFEDSDVGSPQNYPTIKTPNHEPFIPEPDYESSEDDFMSISVDKGGNLSTFGKGDSGIEEKVTSQLDFPEKSQTQSDITASLSPHAEAKRAIQEARERLRFSQKPLDKNATVVFISGKITEHKVEKSEIQLHRTEEGRLTGTVVISTTNEPQESLYLSSSILKTYENEKCSAPRYPSRDAPASEYAKYRQQILSGMNQPGNSENNTEPVVEMLQNDTREDKSDAVQLPESESRKEYKPAATDGLKITLTGSQKCPDNKNNVADNTEGENAYLHLKGIASDFAESCSSGVSSDMDTQSDQIGVLSSSTEDDSKAETVLQFPNSGHLIESQNVNQSQDDKLIEKTPDKSIEDSTDNSSQHEIYAKKNAKEIAMSLANELQGRQIRNSGVEVEPKNYMDKSCKESSISVIKSAQTKEKRHSSASPRRQQKHTSDLSKVKSSTETSLEESLEVLRLQVNSLGLAAVNEVDVFTELVPPPPEFAASAIASESNSRKESYSSSEIAIAPPPEFSDNSPQIRNKTSSHRTASNVYQRKNYPLGCHLNTSSNTVDLNFLTTLRSKHLPSFNPPEHSLLRDSGNSDLARLKSVQKEFRFKLLQEWTSNDIADWLDSLFLPEYKQRFSEAGITGAKLANMDSNDLMGLGVSKWGTD